MLVAPARTNDRRFMMRPRLIVHRSKSSFTRRRKARVHGQLSLTGSLPPNSRRSTRLTSRITAMVNIDSAETTSS